MSAAPACPHFNSSSSAHAWPSTRQIIEKIVFISCTELPPNLLLMAKLVVLCVLLNRHLPLSSHFLPFLPIFDRLGTPAAFHWVLTGVFGVAALALFLNFRVRTACLILGLSLFVSVLASRSYFSNNLVYCGCLLLLTGLHQPGREPWPLRFQVALLYFGAGLNKALDIDWRSGQFFEHWFGYVHHHLIYVRIASLAPPLLLSQVMSWAAIATEFFLAAAFLVRRLFPYAIWLGLLYHTTILFLMNSTFGLFYYAVAASYLPFVTWPTRPVSVIYDRDCGLWEKLRTFFTAIDLDRLFEWKPLPIAETGQAVPRRTLRESLRLLCGTKVYTGYRALKKLLLYSPAAYLVFAVIMRAPEAWHHRRWVAVGALVLFSSIDEVVDRMFASHSPRVPQQCGALQAAGRSSS